MSIDNECVIALQTGWQSFLSPLAILATGILATTGWVLTNRHNRDFNRKQHTMTALLADDDLKEGLDILRTYVNNDEIPEKGTISYQEWEKGLRSCLIYYEFLCGGILREDFDEELVKTMERYNVIRMYNYAQSYIVGTQNSRPQGDHTQKRDRLWKSLQTIALKWEAEERQQ